MSDRVTAVNHQDFDWSGHVVDETAEEHEALIVAAARKAGLHPVLPWRRDEYLQAGLSASLSAPTLDHPRTPEEQGHLYVAVQAFVLSDGSGGEYRVEPGHVLTPLELEAAGSALDAMVSRHEVAALPDDSGIIDALHRLLRRVDRLEQAIRLLRVVG